MVESKKEQYIELAANIVLSRMISENIKAFDEITKAKIIKEILENTLTQKGQYLEVYVEVLNVLNNTIIELLMNDSSTEFIYN